MINHLSTNNPMLLKTLYNAAQAKAYNPTHLNDTLKRALNSY